MNVGAATAYFGAETQQFQAGVRRVTTDLDSLGGTYDQFGSRGARSFLVMANGMTDLTRMTEAGAGGVGIALAQLSYHFGHASEQMQAAAGSARATVAALGRVAEAGALVAAAFGGGWELGKKIAEWSGFTDTMRRAGKSSEEFAASLVAAEGPQEKFAGMATAVANAVGIHVTPSVTAAAMKFNDFKDTTLRMATALGVAVPESVRLADATLAGARAVVEFHDSMVAADKAAAAYLAPVKAIGDELLKTTKAHADLVHSFHAASIEAGAETLVLKDKNKVLQSAYEAITAHVAKEKEWDAVMAHAKGTVAEQAAAVINLAQENEAYVKSLISVNNLMPETSKSLEEQTRDFRLLAGAGVDAKNLLESDLAKAYAKAEDAGLNTGKKLTDSQIQLANAIKDHDIFAVQQWIDKNKEVPTSVDEAVTKAIPHIDEFQKRLMESTTEPFGAGLKAFRELAAEVDATPIKVNIDVNTSAIAAEIRAAIDAALAGRTRSDSGTAG